MRELRLKYFIDLVSNIGARARADAQVLGEAQKQMQTAVERTGTKLEWWSRTTKKSAADLATMKEVITGTTDKFAALDRVISQVGRNTSTERQIGYLQRLGLAAERVQNKALHMRQALAAGIDKAPEKFAELGAGYYGGKRMIVPPIQAYSSLESATQDLRIAMTGASGKVSKDFDKISVEATALGNQLPGTTKDFMRAARALSTQGVPNSVVANGGLRASAYTGVLLDLNQEQGAEVIAKLREAHGLKDNELVPMADLVQRAFFGFGIKPQDYLETAKYAASTYNTMGITGLGQARETLAIQGMAANVGLEGSSFGTNYSMMLRRLGEVESRQGKKSKEAQEVREMLQEHGIKMQFYNDAGVFKGNLNMLQQLAKLRELSPLDQQKVTTRLFGVEAGRPAQILIQKGLEGYHAAQATIAGQADLDTRIALKMDTFAAKLEALGGTIENVQARVATQLGQALKPVIDGSNKVIGGPVAGFLERNPTVGTAGLVGAAGIGAWLTGRLGGSLLKALILRGAPAAGAAAAEGAAVAGGAAQATAAGGAAAAGAASSGITALAKAGSVLKYGGITAAAVGGLQAVQVLADDKEAEKGRALARIGVTTGSGLLAGAAAGALVGTFVPVVGTLLGAIIGGAAGSLGSGALFDAMWAKKTPEQREAERLASLPPAPGAPPTSAFQTQPAAQWLPQTPTRRGTMPRPGYAAWPHDVGSEISTRPVAANYRGAGYADPRRLDAGPIRMPLAVPQLDWLTLTAPNMAPTTMQPGRTTELKVGEGRLDIAVRVTDERVTATPTMTKPLSIIRVNAGATNPGGF